MRAVEGSLGRSLRESSKNRKGFARAFVASFDGRSRTNTLPVLYEQQACGANIFPGGRTEEDFTLLDGAWKCGFRFPE